jgi:hypothetical protein
MIPVIATLFNSVDQIEAWIGSRKPENYARAMSSGGESMFVAEFGGRVVGFTSVRVDTLLAMYVGARERTRRGDSCPSQSGRCSPQ